MHLFRRTEGFTPLEVLIAMAILAIGVVGVFQFFPTALRQVRQGYEMNEAARMADSRLGQLRTLGGRVLTYRWHEGAKPPAAELELLSPEEQEALEALRYETLSDMRGSQPEMFAYSTEGTEEQGVVFRQWSTEVTRIPGFAGGHLHRTTLIIEMASGRREQFVTYVAEP